MLHSKYNLVTNDMQSKENYFIPNYLSISDIPTDILNLFICDYGNSLNRVEFSHSFCYLKSIMIGIHCFKNVREFIIDNLPNLELVRIGEDCFRIGEEERDDGLCQITNCPSLRQLEIGDNSFQDFKSFELSNVDSLQSIIFGRLSFKYADFSLNGE